MKKTLSFMFALAIAALSFHASAQTAGLPTVDQFMTDAQQYHTLKVVKVKDPKAAAAPEACKTKAPEPAVETKATDVAAMATPQVSCPCGCFRYLAGWTICAKCATCPT